MHEKIDLVAAIQYQAFVVDRQVHLPLKAQSTKVKFVAKTLLVSRFQEPWTEVAMNLNGCGENRARTRIPRLSSVPLGFYVNMMEGVAHLTISSRNRMGYCEKGGNQERVAHNGKNRRFAKTNLLISL